MEDGLFLDLLQFCCLQPVWPLFFLSQFIVYFDLSLYSFELLATPPPLSPKDELLINLMRNLNPWQTLAGNMNQPNRDACGAATKPLVESVDRLTAYALSPDFAPVPAKISDEVSF